MNTDYWMTEKKALSPADTRGLNGKRGLVT